MPLGRKGLLVMEENEKFLVMRKDNKRSAFANAENSDVRCNEIYENCRWHRSKKLEHRCKIREKETISRELKVASSVFNTV